MFLSYRNVTKAKTAYISTQRQVDRENERGGEEKIKEMSLCVTWIPVPLRRSRARYLELILSLMPAIRHT